MSLIDILRRVMFGYVMLALAIAAVLYLTVFGPFMLLAYAAETALKRNGHARRR